MTISIWTVVGVLAALLTSTSFIPQLILRIRKPDHARMSYGTLVTFITGALFWTAYGIHLKDWIIICANIFIISNLTAIIILQTIREKH